MFILVWSISTLIGILIVLEASILILLWAMILFPFAFICGVLIVVFDGLRGALTGDGDSTNGMRKAEEISRIPIAWARRIISVIWARVGHYLHRAVRFKGDNADHGRGAPAQKVTAVEQERDRAYEASSAASKAAEKSYVRTAELNQAAHEAYMAYMAAEERVRKAAADQKRDQGYASFMLGVAVVLDLFAISLLVWKG